VIGKTKPVLVTDGNQRSALAVVRALGAAGIPLVIGETEDHSLAGSSRYCAARVVYPSPLDSPQAFREWLLEQAASRRYGMLLPVTDITVQIATAAREELQQHVALPLPTSAQVELSQDKRALLPLANEAVLMTPRTWLRQPAEPLEQFAARLQFPVIVKPRFSKRWRDGAWRSGATRYVEDATQFVSAYRECEQVDPEPLVQEQISGGGIGVFLLLWNGELRASFCHRRVREKPPSGGVSVLCESVAPDTELIAASTRLLQRIGWQGVAMVEFKRDARTGVAKLMEINARFWGSLQLAIDAGVNFPLLLHRVAMGKSIPSPLPYRVGLRSRWLLGDLDHLLIRLRARDSLRLEGSRWSACVPFFAWNENTRQEVLRRDDAAPGYFELKQYARHLLGKAGIRAI